VHTCFIFKITSINNVPDIPDIFNMQEVIYFPGDEEDHIRDPGSI
jgi:hypothetical protein